MTRAAATFALICLVAPAGATQPPDPAPKWEARAVAALAASDQKGLAALAAEYRQLTLEARRELPLRVRDDSVEFTFRGEYPADKTPWQMLEYLVCDAGRDYETLLVAPEAELRRVQALRPVFEKWGVDGRRRWWSARLVWAEDGVPRSVDLADLLILLDPKERDRFRDQLEVNSVGLGGSMNVEADPATLPRRRVPAVLLLTLRLALKD
jgi:hypothetical protein